MNLFLLLEKVEKNSTISIKGCTYSALAMVKYVTATELDNWYVKIKLSGNKVLVIAPFDDYVYFGEVGPDYPCEFPGPEEIEYDGYLYTKVASDYQIVKEFVFGNALEMEGEVVYSDYVCGERIISLGVIKRTNSRADVYADIIYDDDIEIVSD